MSYRKYGVTQSLSCLPHQVEFICHPLCVCVCIYTCPLCAWNRMWFGWWFCFDCHKGCAEDEWRQGDVEKKTGWHDKVSARMVTVKQSAERVSNRGEGWWQCRWWQGNRWIHSRRKQTSAFSDPTCCSADSRIWRFWLPPSSSDDDDSVEREREREKRCLCNYKFDPVWSESLTDYQPGIQFMWGEIGVNQLFCWPD